ncbi:hypothetical protein UFOVP1320_24 [uncultured Caudovirales phage]|uniref:Uncharacterized protein n=1 Tax=uncultured Caudovirales phage TaxID=2100421 RepID=A0A6J5MSE9_9CAUD|nr:hypothetical protein UFOVP548_39 [uncultured Caudovirales phage]CAB4170103.1 hypothetical protein UFOVP904_39 [uncultured Caudovirales phage]CAB4182422.1 hypothetical protein UFOVP1079_20 [uncultured Caudovirales phage]CAB4197642.1 hypothetical protein UFOVP1320_24 [uncultured Caudovirales phage]CAB4211741.1 hypothetical protein UFOVP1431_31 [uncultured Caudovirales phage]
MFDIFYWNAEDKTSNCVRVWELKLAQAIWDTIKKEGYQMLNERP